MDLQEIMKQAQIMQAKMQELQARSQTMEATGQSGGGLVKATVNGVGEVRSVEIDGSLLKPDEKSMVEDLIVAALNDARSKVGAVMQQEMARLTQGMPQPPGGFKLPGM
ncbi:MAG: YbaB/EbfC family nucleoid-associated protein [Alphaproteobacteria bacterium]|jgi:DNA-binding YbaB/EbfC family protein|nr:YbaB/EbfC family nucleoid-associated protein [Alphaproteobacteria bacterium]